MPHLKRLLQHKAGLRHRSLRSVHKQDNTVHHFEHTLHLAAEIGVPRCVDNIYLDVLIMNRRIFCKNRNPPLALQIVIVHNTLGNNLVFTESPALPEHLVNESCLSVVDVRHDSDIS